MKVAVVIPFAFEWFFVGVHGFSEIIDKSKAPDEFEERVICKADSFHINYCRAVMRGGMEPTLYHLSMYGKTVKEFTHKYGFKIKRVPINFGLKKIGWEYSYSLLKELSKDRPDIVFSIVYYLNLQIPDMYDILALYCKLNGLPFVSRYAGSNGKRFAITHRARIPGRLFAKKLALRLTDIVLSQAKSEITDLKKYLNVDSDKIIYFNNPTDLGNFNEIPKKLAAKNLGRDPDKKYILFVGNLYHTKGSEYVIMTMPKIMKLYPHIQLLIIGEGSYKKYLQRLVRDYGLNSYVSFLGHVPPHQLNLYYNLADVFNLPSYKTEGTPNVFLEALACNTPCIGSTVGGIPDLLSDNVGILVPPKKKDELFMAITKILDGNFSINQIKRKKLLEEISMTNVGRRLREIFKEVITNY